MITKAQRDIKAHRRVMKKLKTARNNIDKEIAQAEKFKGPRYARERKRCEKKIEDLEMKVSVLEVRELRLNPEVK